MPSVHGFTGMLGEGKLFRPCTRATLIREDGIHVDMNHLKKGEVK